MKLRTLATLVALGFAPAALAQAPAAAPAAKPSIPMLCTNCHKAGPNETFGNFENVAFKSQSIQLKIDDDDGDREVRPEGDPRWSTQEMRRRRRRSGNPQGARGDDRVRREGRGRRPRR